MAVLAVIITDSVILYTCTSAMQFNYYRHSSHYNGKIFGIIQIMLH